jgi:hypothetical protein
MKKHFLFFLCLLAANVISSCGDNGAEPAAPQIDISNKDAVSQSLVITGATRKAGAPPAPKGTALLLQKGAHEPLGIAGGMVRIVLNERESDTFAGVYLKIEGSNDYFDIPKASLTVLNGRVQDKDDQVIDIPLPSNLKPGEFCIEYCIYDASSNVSNIVRECFEVLAFGGNTGLSGAAWEFEYVNYYEDGVLEESDTFSTKNKTHTYSNEDIEICATSGEPKVLTDRGNYYTTLSFSKNGAFSYDEVDKGENMRLKPGTCIIEKFSYISKEGSLGAWSYNESTKELIFIIAENYSDYTENGVPVEGEPHPIDEIYAFKAKVSQKNNRFYLSIEDGSGDREEYILVKK